ncbi:MAG TPA: YetF domain-containing protein [Marmoricola sp.]|nr:YetF domain-containing protein [Marmoricola sp.]
MHWLIHVDWKGIFVPDTSVLEIFVRGTIVYLVLFLMLRLVLKRQRGGVAFTDLLVIVLVADAAQNAMAGQYNSLPDGLLLVAVIIGWAYTLDWLGYRVPWVQRLLNPRGVHLVRDGHVVRHTMRKENITDEELRSELRTQGVDDLDEVDEVILEGDGRVSVVRKDRERPQTPRRREV